MRDNYHLSELCETLGVSRSGYHARQTRPPGLRHEQNQRLLGAMEAIHHHWSSPEEVDAASAMDCELV